MDRYIEVILTRRNVRCIARMLHEQAPRTCDIIWQALPQEGDVFHAKYASNEIYTLVPDFSDGFAAVENLTITPTVGDLLFFYLRPGSRLPRGAPDTGTTGRGVVDLAVFYDRDNLLLSPCEGFTPGTVFARVVEYMEAMRDAGHSVWREGAVGERLIFRQLAPDQVSQVSE